MPESTRVFTQPLWATILRGREIAFGPRSTRPGSLIACCRLFEERELLKSGYGITNVVPRATASADLLTKEEIVAGGERLTAKVLRYGPRVLAVLGVGAYRTAFRRPKAMVGQQEERIGDTVLWVLPNPSGLNANYQAAALAKLFRELREYLSS